MVKQLDSIEEAYFKDFLNENCTLRNAQDQFLLKFKRKLSLKNIQLGRDRCKKIRKVRNQNNLIQTNILNNRKSSWQEIVMIRYLTIENLLGKKL